MSCLNLNNLNESQYDVLREIGNIGAGNAATALSKLLNQKIDMSVPDVALLSFDEVCSFMGDEDDIAVGVFIEMQGDVKGMILFIFDIKSAHSFLNKLMNSEQNPSEIQFDDMQISALNEIGNIVSGSYLTAVSKLTGLRMISTIPNMTVDMIGAILSVPSAEFGIYGDKLLLIESQFGKDDCINGYFLMIPELDSYEKILKTLEIK